MTNLNQSQGSIATISNREDLLTFLIKNSLNTINENNPPISFDRNGKPISYWNDSQWVFDSDIGIESFTFNLDNYNKLNNTFFTELKYFSLVLFYKNYKKYRNLKEIKSKAQEIFTFLFACQELDYSSICDLEDEIKFISMMEKIKGIYAFGTLSSKLSTLRAATRIDNPYFSLNINFGLKKEKTNKSAFDVKQLSIKYSNSQGEVVNQTLYIPIGIHSKLIESSIDYILEKKDKIDNYMNFFEDAYLSYEEIQAKYVNNQTKIKLTQKELLTIRQKRRDELLNKYNLTDFSSYIEVEKEVRILAIASSILILNFSGMRINEMLNIKEDGFNIINCDPKLYIIRTYETKISGGQIVDYVTSPIVEEAFKILKRVNSVAKKYDPKLANNDNLFVSSRSGKLLAYGSMDNIIDNIAILSIEFGLVINEQDVRDSELLNGPREEVKVGNIWPLASHQFRRTLIVNFVSHRLSSINAVKQQVKHMYATMTEYYAKNSQLAETFNLNVVKEISLNIEEELLNEGVRQYKNFYYSNEQLAGIKGKEIMEERKIAKVLSDNEIKQLFKTGLYKISKSIYGYCTKGNLCDKKDAIDPTFCGANCSTMIITKENALNWQKLYFKNKKLLDSSNNLIVGGIPMNAAKTTMQSQNEIAKQIMNSFNMKYED